MAYAILRVAKLKTMGNVSGHGSHVERQRQTLNADPEKVNLNQRLAGTSDPAADVKVRFDEMQIEPRKGAVVAIDVFSTFFSAFPSITLPPTWALLPLA